jgi:hypothetical protein
VLLLGRVIGADGKPAAGVAITLAEIGPPPTPEKPLVDRYTTGSDGLFQFCSKSLHRGMTLAVRARRGSSISRAVTVRLNDNLTVLRLPLDARP